MPAPLTTVPSPYSPADTIGRIERYLLEWKDESLPTSLRDGRVLRLSLDSRNGNALTIRFSIIGNARMLRYCDCVVEPVTDGADASRSQIQFSLRGSWRPRTVALMVFALLCVQAIYELISGTFDRVTLVVALVIPALAALMAHLETRLVRKKFTSGMTDALQIALADSRNSEVSH